MPGQSHLCTFPNALDQIEPPGKHVLIFSEQLFVEGAKGVEPIGMVGGHELGKMFKPEKGCAKARPHSEEVVSIISIRHERNLWTFHCYHQHYAWKKCFEPRPFVEGTFHFYHEKIRQTKALHLSHSSFLALGKNVSNA